MKQHTLTEQTESLSSFPSRKQRRPLKKRQLVWLQLIVALFICVILVTLLGLGGYLSKEATDGDGKYQTLPTPSTKDPLNGGTSEDDDTINTDNDGTEDPDSGDIIPATDDDLVEVEEGSSEEDVSEETPDSTKQFHTVGNGETLYAITKQYYGSGSPENMELIIKANNISDPSHVEAGTKLIIPAR